jgi:DNA (cytosine-5)-methyltransferase 1
MTSPTAISLFCSSGIGDLALRRDGINVLVANELIEERCDLFEYNFPETNLIRGSIWEKKETIIQSTLELLKGKPLDFALITPPCQGMSKNGRGKLLAEVRAGRRSKVDERNMLIIPSLEIIKKLQPTTVVFENVPEMINTVIPNSSGVIEIVELIREELSEWYVEPKVVEFADYGIPQRRQRLITVATKDPRLLDLVEKEGSIFPPQTHSKGGCFFTEKWKTVRDIISDFEPLDGFKKPKSEKHLLHYVPKLDERKYFWVSNTPEGKSAFDNQCVKCGFDENPTHSSKKNKEGVNRASVDTPIICESCGSLLPRPAVTKNGETRLMKGFTSAYKRMEWDSPASAITRNFPYVCSDNKIHPEQHRTLSVLEALALHSIEKDEYKFQYASGKKVSTVAVRDTLGESVPPKFLEILFKYLLPKT